MVTTLVVTNDFPPRIGGIESFVEDVCTLLGGDVVVYTSGAAAAAEPSRGYPVIRDGDLLLPTPRVRDRAVALLREHGCSRVVFGAAAPLGLIAPALRRAGATTILALTHGHETWWATVPGARSLLRRIGNGCDHLSTISDYTTRRIAPALSPSARDQLIRLPPPVDSTRFRPAPKVWTGRDTCIAVGRMVPQKGYATLLRAWRIVMEGTAAGSGPRELVLVGDGPQRPRLEELINTWNLHSSVRLTGALPRAAVLGELQRAQVFAAPVRTRLAGLNPEGLGLAALEAAACGLPVIVGDSGGAPETVRHGDTGFVIRPKDHQELARRISQLFENPSQAAAMGGRGRAYVIERFGRDQARSTLLSALALD
jgi:phosphatidylinositol alpha-1,6-mannosyltransferase